MNTQQPDSNLNHILAQIKDQKHLPVHQWHPDISREINMRIARDGTWVYMGSPIQRHEMVKLFSSILRREPDGTFVLVTPVERLGIQVDDAPFVAVEANIHQAGPTQSISLRTNVDELVIAGPDHPIRVQHHPDTGEPSPYVLVREGLWALIARPVFYQLVDAAQEAAADGAAILTVHSAGESFPLGPTA